MYINLLIKDNYINRQFPRSQCVFIKRFFPLNFTLFSSDGDYQVPPHTSNDLMPHPLPSAYRKTHQAMVQFQNDSPPTNNVEERHTTIHVTATSSSMGRGKGRGMTRQSGHAQKGVSSHIPTVLVQRHSV